jgi:hypothetical protein
MQWQRRAHNLLKFADRLFDRYGGCQFDSLVLPLVESPCIGEPEASAKLCTVGALAPILCSHYNINSFDVINGFNANNSINRAILKYLIIKRGLPRLLMAGKDKDTVMLRVEVSEALRNRLKAQSARMGITMGELVERLVDESITLKELELEALKKLEQEK